MMPQDIMEIIKLSTQSPRRDDEHERNWRKLNQTHFPIHSFKVNLKSLSSDLQWNVFHYIIWHATRRYAQTFQDLNSVKLWTPITICF
jgi:hypothetical protein